MSEIKRYDWDDEDMILATDGDYVKWEDHQAALRELRGGLNTSSWRTLETVIDAMAKAFFAGNKSEALSFANRAVKKTRINPEEGA